MTEIVIKKDGNKESFSVEKLRRSIENAVVKTEGFLNTLQTAMINHVLPRTLKKLENQEQIDSQGIKDIIFFEITSVGKSILDTWTRYEASK